MAIDLIGLFSNGITHEPLLASLYGGIICGLGLGLVFSANASTGGSDVIAKLFKRRFEHVNLGRLMLIVDFIVVLLGAVVFNSYDIAMFAIISIFVSSKVMDGVLYGFDFSKVCYIISDHDEELSKAILVRLERGVTHLYARGAYSGRDKNRTAVRDPAPADRRTEKNRQ